eukprot:CAMPEP_0195569516 /NCGR_PEP_ID=MMETSP0814-20130614/2871_1 /TAXON_ID=97485 /ORGANISM="Prymnesium parvum, Strain Texoma1" /LENGTH=279 /DNA_ID=CAMNT_0040704905 /DNA_START=239 /DNA_END=1075 /DNA_ORIENTATION=+
MSSSNQPHTNQVSPTTPTPRPFDKAHVVQAYAPYGKEHRLEDHQTGDELMTNNDKEQATSRLREVKHPPIPPLGTHKWTAPLHQHTPQPGRVATLDGPKRRYGLLFKFLLFFTLQLRISSGDMKAFCIERKMNIQRIEAEDPHNKGDEEHSADELKQHQRNSLTTTITSNPENRHAFNNDCIAEVVPTGGSYQPNAKDSIAKLVPRMIATYAKQPIRVSHRPGVNESSYRLWMKTIRNLLGRNRSLFVGYKRMNDRDLWNRKHIRNHAKRRINEKQMIK